MLGANEGQGEEVPERRLPSPGEDRSRSRAKRELSFDVAWLTALGVAIYVALRFPYAVYYDSLGASPEDVGLDYANLLAQSSGLLVIIALLSGMLALLPVANSMYQGIFVLAMKELLVFVAQRRRGRVEGATPEAASSEFYEKVRTALAANSALRLRAEKQIAKLQHLAAAGNLSALLMFSRALKAVFVISVGLLAEFLRAAWKPWRRLFPWIVLSFFLLLLLVVLPLVALDSATRSRFCQPTVPLPGFNLGADPVHVYDSVTLAPRLAARQLILLGDSSSTYVLYDCRAHETIRIPMNTHAVIRDAG